MTFLSEKFQKAFEIFSFILPGDFFSHRSIIWVWDTHAFFLLIKNKQFFSDPDAPEITTTEILLEDEKNVPGDKKPSIVSKWLTSLSSEMKRLLRIPDPWAQNFF